MVHSFEQTMTGLLIEAQELSAELLDSLPERYAHSQAVGTRACEIADSLGYPRAFCIQMKIIGVLHDIGYSPELVFTGHHAFDGGAFLCGHTLLADYAPDVAWHSTAEAEARNRKIEMPDIPYPPRNRQRILWVADFTTSPTGELISIEERLSNIRNRYEPDSPVVKALDESMDDLIEAARFCGVDIRSAVRL